MESETETRPHSTKAKYAHILDASHENLYTEKKCHSFWPLRKFIVHTNDVRNSSLPTPLIISEPQRGDDPSSNCTVEVNNNIASAHRFDGNGYLLLYKKVASPI